MSNNRTIISFIVVESQIFVTMATRASLWQISLIPLCCPPSKTHCLVQDSPLYLFYKPSYRQFSVNIPKFSLQWQQGSVWGLLGKFQ